MPGRSCPAAPPTSNATAGPSNYSTSHPNLGTFDAIFSCNVWLFWAEPVATITTLAGLLKPRANLAITHLPRHRNAGRADTEAAAQRIGAQMQDAGLHDIRSHLLELHPAPAACVIAARAQEADQ